MEKLQNSKELENGVVIRYPSGIKISANTEIALRDHADYLEYRFGQKVMTIFINRNKAEPSKLHAISYTFRKSVIDKKNFEGEI